MTSESEKHNKKKIRKKSHLHSPKLKWVSTRLLDDVFTDEVSLFKPEFKVDYEAYLQRLWDSNAEIYEILKNVKDLETAREELYNYLDEAERKVFNIDNDLHILEKSTVRECIRVFRSIIGPINEFRTEFSALESLWKLAQNRRQELKSEISVGFILEFINLFRGVTGRSNIYLENTQVKKGIPEFLKIRGKQAALVRMEILDDLGTSVRKYFKKYPSGLEEEVATWRTENRNKVLRYFKGTEDDWNDYKWHLKNVIKDATPLLGLIELTNEQKEAVDKAVKNKVAFGITPYYLSLMDTRFSIGYDHAIRAQVIPSMEYVEKMIEYHTNPEISYDFMGEHDTSPVDLVTRRYPVIAIIKPFNTCAQICVYCQRNWEIERVLEPRALASKVKVDEALAWFDKHKSIGDVLIT
jgi:lysine 2,3-aminomutase